MLDDLRESVARADAFTSVAAWEASRGSASSASLPPPGGPKPRRGTVAPRRSDPSFVLRSGMAKKTGLAAARCALPADGATFGATTAC